MNYLDLHLQGHDLDLEPQLRSYVPLCSYFSLYVNHQLAPPTICVVGLSG